MTADPGARIDQVLAIIERQEQPARPQRFGERFQQGAPGLFADPDGRRDTRDHEIGLPQVTQLDKPHPVRKLIRDRGQDLQSQPGLPDTPGATQRQRARHAHELAQLVELTLTADEGILILGEIGRDLFYLIPRGPDSGAQSSRSIPPNDSSRVAAGRRANTQPAT